MAERSLAEQARAETRKALSFWAAAACWLPAWLTYDVPLAGGWPLGRVLLYLGLVLGAPGIIASIWGDTRSILAPWRGSEAERARDMMASATAGTIALQVAIWMSVASLLGLWPLAGHEVGLATVIAFALTEQTRRTLLIRREAARAG